MNDGLSWANVVARFALAAFCAFIIYRESSNAICRTGYWRVIDVAIQVGAGVIAGIGLFFPLMAGGAAMVLAFTLLTVGAPHVTAYETEQRKADRMANVSNREPETAGKE